MHNRILMFGAAWFAVAVGLLLGVSAALAHEGHSSTLPSRLEDVSTAELVHQITHEADEGSATTALVQTAGERGMEAALACIPYLSKDELPRSTALYQVMTIAGRSRRSHPELLRLYDPAAYKTFYAEAGAAEQTRLAVALDWPQWPQQLAESVVRAAPRPLLAWLKQQARSSSPQLEHLQEIWRQWGWWIHANFERQYVTEVHEAIRLLSANNAIVADAPTRAVLLRFIGDARAGSSVPFAVAALSDSDAAVRAEACVAIGALASAGSLDAAASQQAAKALIDLSTREPDVTVLAKLAAAAEAWPEDRAIGQAMFDLFSRVARPEVRREILFSATNARWPQRSSLALRALTDPDGGVVGVALQAAANSPSADMIPGTMRLLEESAAINPALVDAAGALRDPRAVPHLLRWLATERNAALQLKLALALEKIGGDEANRALLDMLNHQTDPLLMEHLVAIAGRTGLPGAEPVLISLAEDATAPMRIRLAALWSMGRFDTPAVQQSLERLAQRPQEHFADPAQPANAPVQAERAEAASLYITMAQVRLGQSAAEQSLADRYARGVPTTQLSMLMMLANLKRDHAVIQQALQSTDLAVLLAAVKAAAACGPRKYHEQLLSVRGTPFVAAAADSGLDVMGLKTALDRAIQAGDVGGAQ